MKADRLLPVQNGGNIRSYYMARDLATRHAVTFFSYYGGQGPDTEYEAALLREFPRAVAMYTGIGESGAFARTLDYARRFSDPTPYAVSRFRSPRVQQQLARWYAEGAFDVVICDFLDAAVNFPAQLDIPSVLFQHNVETEIWRRHTLNASGLKRTVYAREARKMLGYEQQTVQRFHHVIAVSESDRRLMSAWADSSRVSAVPTGVDLAQFRPDLTRTAEKPVVMFVGAMDWMPNVDGAEYFCREIWPSIVRRVPEARFRIVGRNPVARVQQLASDTVEVTGKVPSVVEHLREAAVVVVPLRVGGGTRLKIYEAMAVGRAVVSTTVGAEGLDVQDQQDILLADDASKFAEGVCRLLLDVPARRRYERAAAESAARFDWPVVTATFERILESQLRAAVTGAHPVEV